MLFRALALAVLVAGAPLAAQQPAPAAPTPAAKKPAKKAAAKKPAAPAADTASQITVTGSGTTLITAVVPAPDQSRGVDAELRAALFDIVSDRPLTALSRLQWLASSTTALSAKPAEGQRTREDLLFLLAESYYRLGLSVSFRTTAQQLLKLAPAGRYVPIVQLQLMLDAYRRGDYAAAHTLASKTADSPDPALTQFVAGLAFYQMGEFKNAREQFARIIAAGNQAYLPYARYMDVLASMGGDPARAGMAFDSLQSLVTSSSGPFGDQVKLAAAQLAFQGGQYQAAADVAAQVSPDGGLLPEAVLARAWALYRAGQADSSAALFSQYAGTWPLLPGRDESRLMHGQILLEQKQAAAAGDQFAQTSDSLGAEIAAIQSRMNAVLAQASRALVTARSAGAAYLRDAESGKAIDLAPDAGAEGSVLVTAFGGVPAPLFPDSAAPGVVTFKGVQGRFAAMEPALPADVPQRIFYLPASSPKAYPQFVESDQALLAADLAAATAQYRLRLALGDRAMRIAALRNFQRLIVEGNANLVEMNKQIAETQDSLDRMSKRLVTARQILREAMERQTALTAKMARLNIAKLDSLKHSLGSTADSSDLDVIDSEIATANLYLQLADTVRFGADTTIKRHPVFVLRDSLASRVVQARALSVQGQQILVVNAALVTVELARLEGSESEPTRVARQELSAAEQRRAAAEAQMVSLLDGELRARAAQMVESLKRSREAADYGSASAAFFVAIEAKAAQGGAAPSAPAPAPEQQR